MWEDRRSVWVSRVGQGFLEQVGFVINLEDGRAYGVRLIEWERAWASVCTWRGWVFEGHWEVEPDERHSSHLPISCKTWQDSVLLLFAVCLSRVWSVWRLKVGEGGRRKIRQSAFHISLPLFSTSVGKEDRGKSANLHYQIGKPSLLT